MERNPDEPMVQLATRIPKPLHKEVKLYCVETGTTVMDFVVDALERKLARAAQPSRRRRSAA